MPWCGTWGAGAHIGQAARGGSSLLGDSRHGRWAIVGRISRQFRSRRFSGALVRRLAPSRARRMQHSLRGVFFCALRLASRALGENSQGQSAIPPEELLGCPGEASGAPGCTEDVGLAVRGASVLLSDSLPESAEQE